MRSTLISLLSLVALMTNSLALSGGPWGDNTTGSNGGQGTYQAIIQMRNGSGIARFTEASGGQGSGAQVSVFNSSQIFYRGIIYVGTCFAVVDTNKKRVTGMTNGSSSGFQSASGATDANSFNVNVSIGETSGNSTAAASTSASGGVVGNANTNWNGQVTDTSPILEFEAEGEAYFFGDLDSQQIQTVDIQNNATVNGDILEAFEQIIAAFNGGGNNPGVTIQGIDDLLTLFNTSVEGRDSNTVISTSSGGQDNVFPEIGVRVPIRVYGHQISFSVSNPIGGGGLTGLEGTGRGTFLF